MLKQHRGLLGMVRKSERKVSRSMGAGGGRKAFGTEWGTWAQGHEGQTARSWAWLQGRRLLVSWRKVRLGALSKAIGWQAQGQMVGRGTWRWWTALNHFCPLTLMAEKKMSLRYKITKCVGSKLRSYLAHLSLDAEVIYQKSQSLWWRQDTRNLLVFFTNIPHPQATPARIFVSFIENSQELSGVSTT